MYLSRFFLDTTVIDLHKSQFPEQRYWLVTYRWSSNLVDLRGLSLTGLVCTMSSNSTAAGEIFWGVKMLAAALIALHVAM